MTAEYPSTDLRRIMVSKLEEMSIPLFADDAFTPYFHKSYTALSPDELQAMQRNAITCTTSTYKTQFQVLSTLMFAFETRVTSHAISPAKLPQELQLLSQTRARIASSETQMAALPLTAESANALQRIKAATAPGLNLLWPSERNSFNGQLASEQARFAVPVFASRAQLLLSAPDTTQTLVALRQASIDADALPSPDREAWKQKLNARYADLLNLSMDRQKIQMLAFRGTPEGLQDGANWLSGFKNTYIERLNAPGATDLVTQYLAIRQKQLEGQELALRRRIDSAETADGLNSFVDAAYLLPTDRSTESYARMQQAAGARTAYLERQERLSQQARDAEEARREAKLRGPNHASSTPSRLPAHALTAASQDQDSAGTDRRLSANSFTAHGLNNEATLDHIFRGELDQVGFERDDLQFAGLSTGYMDAYWDQCRDFLTRDRTEIMTQVCSGGYSHWVNGYGMQTSPDTCNGWSTVGTGKFADRSLYNATNALEGQMTKKTLANTLGSVTNAKSIGDLFTGPLNQVSAVNNLKSDVADVVHLNGCTSPGLVRFQANLLALALGKPGILVDGTSVKLIAAEGASEGTVYRDSDYHRLLEDMVTQQARSWVLNRYISGTIGDVRVASRDGMGRPARVSGSYAFNGISGRAVASVTLTFADGLPECLYFSDLPNNCVTPNRQLITAYGKGQYR